MVALFADDINCGRNGNRRPEQQQPDQGGNRRWPGIILKRDLHVPVHFVDIVYVTVEGQSEAAHDDAEADAARGGNYLADVPSPTQSG